MSFTILKNTLLFTLLVLITSTCKEDDVALSSGEAKKLGGDDSRITLHKNNRVISVNLGDEYAAYVKKPENQPITKEIYQYFKDDFDFITVVLNETERPKNKAFGTYSSYKNITENIGIRKFDNSDQYSSKKLQGLLSLTALSYLRKGPSLHEMAHKWANYILKEATHPQLLKAGETAHWGTTGGNVNGQLGGFAQKNLKTPADKWYETHEFPEELINNQWKKTGQSAPDKNWGVMTGFGPNANGGNGIPYSQLELYLMGLIEAEEVEPFDLFTKVNAIISVNPPPGNRFNDIFFNAPDPIRYTPKQLMEKGGGRRLPLPKDQQKDYKMLVVVVTKEPLTLEQWTAIDADAEWFGKKDDGDPKRFTFSEATGGRATMATGDLDKSLK